MKPRWPDYMKNPLLKHALEGMTRSQLLATGIPKMLQGCSLITENMATDWLGSIVSINCGDSLGVYQGRVSAVDQVSQTISLTRPFHNGVKCLVNREVAFRAGDITQLKILEIPCPEENGPCRDFQQNDFGMSDYPRFRRSSARTALGNCQRSPSLPAALPRTSPGGLMGGVKTWPFPPSSSSASRATWIGTWSPLSQAEKSSGGHNFACGVQWPHEAALSLFREEGVNREPWWPLNSNSPLPAGDGGWVGRAGKLVATHGLDL
uniref:Uncharacterized protein n=1 Tax=Sphaerodactylus townsendi TaxID=933632 RepID=A0ACB8E5M4_9SAUR